MTTFSLMVGIGTEIKASNEPKFLSNAAIESKRRNYSEFCF